MNKAAINLKNFLESCGQVEQTSGTSSNRQVNNNSAIGPPAEEAKKKDDDDVWSYLEAQAAFLGATQASLWDGGDLKIRLNQVEVLDMMDMDEFLFENGLQGSSGSLGANNADEALNTTSAKALNTPPRPLVNNDAECSSSSSSSSSGTGSQLGFVKPSHVQYAESAAHSPEEEDEDSDDSDISFAESARQTSAKQQRGKQPVAAGKRKRGAANHSISVASSISGNTSDDGSYVPGLDFDPKNHSFTQEELRPQPMSKKSKKQYVPEDLKDDKYWARRRKNNMAAKRSRDARRVKENQIAMRAAFLENEVVVQNTALRTELEKVNKLYAAALKRLEHYEKQAGKK